VLLPRVDFLTKAISNTNSKNRKEFIHTKMKKKELMKKVVMKKVVMKMEVTKKEEMLELNPLLFLTLSTVTLFWMNPNLNLKLKNQTKKLTPSESSKLEMITSTLEKTLNMNNYANLNKDLLTLLSTIKNTMKNNPTLPHPNCQF